MVVSEIKKREGVRPTVTLQLIQRIPHVKRTISKFSVPLVLCEMALKYCMDQHTIDKTATHLSVTYSWNIVRTKIQLTPNLKSPRHERTIYVLHVSPHLLHALQEEFFCAIHTTCKAKEILCEENNCWLHEARGVNKENSTKNWSYNKMYSSKDLAIFNSDKLNIQTQWTAEYLWQYCSSDNWKQPTVESLKW